MSDETTEILEDGDELSDAELAMGEEHEDEDVLCTAGQFAQLHCISAHIDRYPWTNYEIREVAMIVKAVIRTMAGDYLEGAELPGAAAMATLRGDPTRQVGRDGTVMAGGQVVSSDPTSEVVIYPPGTPGAQAIQERVLAQANEAAALAATGVEIHPGPPQPRPVAAMPDRKPVSAKNGARKKTAAAAKKRRQRKAKTATAKPATEGK